MWPDKRIQNLFGIELPVIQAPMAPAWHSPPAQKIEQLLKDG
jgi:NAD(P)H-dependent flavin oxidoreductase YrpB (nitropropane dioxygenase family)